MPRAGKLYVMSMGDGRVKVGFAVDPDARRKVLRAESLIFETGWIERAELVEKRAHKLLRATGKCVAGEVYAMSDDDAISWVREAERMEREGLIVAKPRPNRRKRPISVRMPVDLIEWLDRFVKEHKPRVSKNAIVEAALKRFLDARM